MNVMLKRSEADPILAEVIRTRLDSIGLETGVAVEKTAVSPIVTESRDYAVTLLDAAGNVLSGTGGIGTHFGAALNAVRATLDRHGRTVAAGDVFIVNDPHSGGGLHPQDVIVHQPVFVDGALTAWVALSAHMMDMGGMVPGSSAVMATECYQEALRFPAVRLLRKGEEMTDIWDVLRTNIRGAAIVEMDVRSLVIGCSVAERKLSELIVSIGAETFAAINQLLISTTERAVRDRIAQLEDGRYRTTAWVEYGPELHRVGCQLTIAGDRLIFDLTDAPPQVPHFFNSKVYILRASIGPSVGAMLARGLPVNQGLYNVPEILARPGTLVESVPPAPIAAAHMDAALPICNAMMRALHMAVYASPQAPGRQFTTAAQFSTYGTGRWAYPVADGQRAVFTMMDGAFGGSPAGWDRDGIDFSPSLVGGGGGLEFPDVEVMETAYPMLFDRRGYRGGQHGFGQFRSGAGVEVAFGPHDDVVLVGNLTGTKSWFPNEGLAGGRPGATMRYCVERADGRVEPLTAQATGVSLAPGDRFVTLGASGGGFGDPLDRELDDIADDMEQDRLDRPTAEREYGVVFAGDGAIDRQATEECRQTERRERLARARAPTRRLEAHVPADAPHFPLYPGVVQCGRYAVAEASGAVLAEAPDNWLDGCPVIETPLAGAPVEVVIRTYLDPRTGRLLHVSVDGPGDHCGLSVLPDRWTQAAQARA